MMLTAAAQAQQTPVTHGMVYGVKPSATQIIKATNLEAYMAKKARISTTISGKVLNVTKTEGGWFDIDGGNGRVIAAHFKNIGISLPLSIKGRTVLVSGVASKQFTADDQQHLAGEQTQKGTKTDPKRKISFEATGVMVEK